ncbi:MAG TPA: hypothetical protein VFB75_17535, partial [Burkholderiales bacterium]|nr:hypothetical protein [Burkholderiales bacterium]
MSMSTSRLDVHGERATLEIRVPSYEARHVADPPRTIPAAIQIDGTQPASAACAEESGSYVCR